jgi:hypothetical protein
MILPKKKLSVLFLTFNRHPNKRGKNCERGWGKEL